MLMNVDMCDLSHRRASMNADSKHKSKVVQHMKSHHQKWIDLTEEVFRCFLTKNAGLFGCFQK